MYECVRTETCRITIVILIVVLAVAFDEEQLTGTIKPMVCSHCGGRRVSNKFNFLEKFTFSKLDNIKMLAYQLKYSFILDSVNCHESVLLTVRGTVGLFTLAFDVCRQVIKHEALMMNGMDLFGFLSLSV